MNKIPLIPGDVTLTEFCWAVSTTFAHLQTADFFCKIAPVQSNWMEGVCEQQFSSLATDAQQDLSLVVCLRSNLRPILKSFAAFNRFSSRFDPCLRQSIFPSALSSFPFPAGEKCAHSMMLPPPSFTAGNVFSNRCTVLHVGPKIQFWSHLTMAPLLCPLLGL